MRNEYFECRCSSDEHRLVFTIDDEFEKDWPPELYSSVFLCNEGQGFFKRLWSATKYVFGYKSKYGHFDCFLMQPEDAPRFQAMVENYIERHDEWVKQLKERAKENKNEN